MSIILGVSPGTLDPWLNRRRRESLYSQITHNKALNQAMGFDNPDRQLDYLKREMDEFVQEYPAMGAICELQDVIGTAKNLVKAMGYDADQQEGYFYKRFQSRLKKALLHFPKVAWPEAWALAKGGCQ